MPPRTRIKICGIRDPQTARAAAAAGADAIGLVFVEGSPRWVSVEQAADIVAALPAFVAPVALFVDAPAAHVRSIAARLGIGTVQLHGQEPPDMAAALAPLRVLKALPFAPATFEAELARWRGAGAGIVVDAPPRDHAGPPAGRGGTGRRLDWQRLATAWAPDGPDGSRPRLVLAGGLTPANVPAAASLLRPGAVDVSSGVESRRGVKDARLIEAFCAAVAEADRGDRDRGVPAAP